MAKKNASEKLTIKTAKLQEMVARAVKGAKDDKILPITQMMAIELKDNVLTLITTTVSTTLYIRENKVEGDNFYVVVPVETFSKLISKLTCDTVTISINEAMKAVEIKGNGTYFVPIEFDEDEHMVVYPDPLIEIVFDPEDSVEINKSTVEVILNTLKPALATTLESPCYTGYYVGDDVIATDRFLINSLAVKLFEEPKLVSSPVMDLLDVMNAEKINVDFKDNIMVFGSPDCTIFSREMEGIEDFAVDAISEFINMDFDSVCKIPKASLLQLLERILLFVSDYDKGSVSFTFTKDGLQVNSKASSAIEVIPYSESNNFKPFMCCVDINMMMKQIKSQPGDVIELWYGNESALKITRDNITQIIALLSDDDIEEDAE